MANPDQGSFGGNMGNADQAPWLFGNPGAYQAHPGYQGHQGYQGYQGYGGYQGAGQGPAQQSAGRGQSQLAPGATLAQMAGMNPQMAGRYPQGYAGSSQFWQGMPNPYRPGASQPGQQQANWPPAAPGMYPQGFGGSAPFWRQQGQQQAQQQAQQVTGPHTGHGPQGYRRSDERIKEDVHDRLTAHGHLDARGITVNANNGEVTLAGTVDSRQAKHTAEDVAESVPGVNNVQNQLKVRQSQAQQGQRQGQQPRQGWERFAGISAPHGLHPTQEAEQRAWQAGSLH